MENPLLVSGLHPSAGHLWLQQVQACVSAVSSPLKLSSRPDVLPGHAPDSCCTVHTCGLLLSAPPFLFQVTTHTSEDDAPSRVTEVVVKLFDADPITVTVPEEVSRSNPKFMETVAEKALQEYRKKQR